MAKLLEAHSWEDSTATELAFCCSLSRRESVVRARISKTNNKISTKSRDTFLSLIKMTRKLKISFWNYIHNKIYHSKKTENLAKIIEKKA
jgi:predicted solute-binding protein